MWKIYQYVLAAAGHGHPTQHAGTGERSRAFVRAACVVPRMAGSCRHAQVGIRQQRGNTQRFQPVAFDCQLQQASTAGMDILG